MKQGERWIIFYTDGSVFTSADGTPWNAPRRDVQSIVSVKDNGTDWYNVNMHDFFYWEEENGGWNEGDGFTLYDHLLRANPPCVLFGRMLSDVNWEKTHKAMRRYSDTYRDWILGRSDERPPQNYF
jgi:hypothetical protein